MLCKPEPKLNRDPGRKNKVLSSIKVMVNPANNRYTVQGLFVSFKDFFCNFNNITDEATFKHSGFDVIFIKMYVLTKQVPHTLERNSI